MAEKLIQVGESIHASIPAPGKAMRQLIDLGQGAYENSSEPLDYIISLIESQAEDGADYIAVNVDSFGESDPGLAGKLMKEYVRLVRKFGKGVPACIDSSDDEVLIAGLKEWYGTEQQVKQPLLNSIKTYNADRLLPLKKDYDYAFIGLLVSEEKSAEPPSVRQLVNIAERIFEKAVDGYGFKPDEIFFDSTVFPLAIDMPMEPDTPGYTYRAFQTIKTIKSHPRLKQCHCSLGISNCARDLPARRIGICRAYVAKAMEYGLDAAIVNVNHKYGQKEPDTKLLELIDAYAQMDGSAEKMTRAMALMGQFCQQSKK